MDACSPPVYEHEFFLVSVDPEERNDLLQRHAIGLEQLEILRYLQEQMDLLIGF